MQTEINLENLTPEQRAAIRALLLPDARRWRAEDRLKDAKRRHVAKLAELQSEQARVTDLKAKELVALEQDIAKVKNDSAMRLARITGALPRIEAEFAQAEAELAAAVAELEAANG